MLLYIFRRKKTARDFLLRLNPSLFHLFMCQLCAIAVLFTRNTLRFLSQEFRCNRLIVTQGFNAFSYSRFNAHSAFYAVSSIFLRFSFNDRRVSLYNYAWFKAIELLFITRDPWIGIDCNTVCLCLYVRVCLCWAYIWHSAIWN